MALKVYSAPADLPVLGAGRESDSCDFKGYQDLTKVWEMAKDMAAFANASGGTLLIGATEDKATGTLQGWRPYSKQEAEDVVNAYNKVALDWCSPRPRVVPVPIEREAGKFAIAVHVWPFTLLPVSVRRKTDPAEDTQDAWMVWVRVGKDNVQFTPEQSAMLMIPKIRNAMTLLDSIPLAKRNEVTAYFAMPQMAANTNNPQHAWRETTLEFVGTRPEEGIAVFKGAAVHRKERVVALASTALHIPLSAIEMVWSLPNLKWCLSIDGQLISKANDNFYTPNL